MMKNFLSLLICSLLLPSLPSVAQEYSGYSSLQLLYGKEQESSGIQLSTLTAEHVGSYGVFEQFGFADFMYNSTNDNFDIYLEWYPKLHLLPYSEEKKGWGPFSAILFGGGINVMVLNPDDFFVALGGPVWQFSVPGFDLLQLETYLYQQLEYSLSYQLTLSWELPLKISEVVRFRFRGFIDHIGPYDEMDNQLITQPQLLLDAGNLWSSPGHIYTGLEWKYWHNFAGMEGVTESIPQLEILIEF